MPSFWISRTFVRYRECLRKTQQQTKTMFPLQFRSDNVQRTCPLRPSPIMASTPPHHHLPHGSPLLLLLPCCCHSDSSGTDSKQLPDKNPHFHLWILTAVNEAWVLGSTFISCSPQIRADEHVYIYAFRGYLCETF